ncbi:UvrD-helicase-domain-containing protein, partial [Delitschia confertaspora ATCC 74209]
MDSFLEGLNTAQRTAVTSPASVLQVLAPPGSGKTKTLTARVAYLISHERMLPWNIIVCTFTIKAAREMRERIQNYLGNEVEGKLILGTFHSVARRFLIRYGHYIGLPKNFGIADSKDSLSILTRIIKRSDATIEPRVARSRISGLKAKSTTAAEFAATMKKAEEHEFARIYSAYEEILRSSNTLDYDDLLLRCGELLRRNPECVSTIQAVLIDEYQDTNHVQYELMTLMAQRMKRITIVGDPDQSIYSFRSAEIQNLHRMRDEYPESIVINLENNYRSSGCILTSAIAVIEQDESRPNKPLLATHCVGERPVLRHLANAHVEARWIVEEIRRSKTLTAGLLDFNDYAILLRSSHLSLSLERALGNAGVPYRMIGGHRFFDRAEIKIVLNYLRAINQPHFNDAIISVINTPTRGIGEETVRKLLEEAETRRKSLWSLVLSLAQGNANPKATISKVAAKGIVQFVNLILTSRQKLLNVETGDSCLLDLIGHVLKKLEFEAYLKKYYPDNWKERWANVEELVAQATGMADTTDDDVLPAVEGLEQRQYTTEDLLSRFLVNVALSMEDEREDGQAPNQVTICTIHAAKGLEWPVVFIPAVYNGSIPHSRADDTDEERRLLYVGMTRAQGLLYLSCPVKSSSQEESTLSKFISDKKIQRLFDARGPAFSFSVVQDLARILRRPCPMPSAIEKAYDLLEYNEDDKYPSGRGEVDSDDEKWANSGYTNPFPQARNFKRRKIENAVAVTDANVQVTMSNASNYSISSTTLQSTGFTTASHIKTLQEAENARMLGGVGDKRKSTVPSQREEIMYTTVSTTMAASSRRKGTKKLPAGQGTLTSFFSRSGPTDSSRSSPRVLEETPTIQTPVPMDPPLPLSASTHTIFQKKRPLNDISNVAVPPSPRTTAYQPPSLPSRKLRNAPMMSKPRR